MHEDCFHLWGQTGRCPLCNVDGASTGFHRLFLNTSQLKPSSDETVWREKFEKLQERNSDLLREQQELSCQLTKAQFELGVVRQQRDQTVATWKKKYEKLKSTMNTSTQKYEGQMQELKERVAGVESLRRFEKVMWTKKYENMIDQRDNEIVEWKLKYDNLKQEKKRELQEVRRMLDWTQAKLKSNAKHGLKWKKTVIEPNLEVQALKDNARLKDVELKNKNQDLRDAQVRFDCADKLLKEALRKIELKESALKAKNRELLDAFAQLDLFREVRSACQRVVKDEPSSEKVKKLRRVYSSTRKNARGAS